MTFSGPKSALLAHAQLLAVGKHDLANPSDRQPALGDSFHGDGHFIAGLYGFGGNSEIDQSRWSVPLANTVDDIAFLVLPIEFQNCVRIAPYPGGHGRFHGNRLEIVG